MKVDIWSDIRCPFCFIGKRKFESALGKFSHKDDVAVIWHSFQLDPGLTTQTDMHVFDYLAKAKGISRDEAVEMHQYVEQVGKDAGVDFNFEKVVVANSFNAHRLIQLAKSKGLGGRAEEELFLAHFTRGQNIDDPGSLLKIGVATGLDEDDIRSALVADEWSDAVIQDEMKARSIGIRAVPFFIFDDKFAVSGAQSPEVFAQALERAFKEAGGKAL